MYFLSEWHRILFIRQGIYTRKACSSSIMNIITYRMAWDPVHQTRSVPGRCVQFYNKHLYFQNGMGSCSSDKVCTRKVCFSSIINIFTFRMAWDPVHQTRSVPGRCVQVHTHHSRQLPRRRLSCTYHNLHMLHVTCIYIACLQ